MNEIGNKWESLSKDIGIVRNVAVRKYEEDIVIVIPAADREGRELSSIW